MKTDRPTHALLAILGSVNAASATPRAAPQRVAGPVRPARFDLLLHDLFSPSLPPDSKPVAEEELEDPWQRTTTPDPFGALGGWSPMLTPPPQLKAGGLAPKSTEPPTDRIPAPASAPQGAQFNGPPSTKPVAPPTAAPHQPVGAPGVGHIAQPGSAAAHPQAAGTNPTVSPQPLPAPLSASPVAQRMAGPKTADPATSAATNDLRDHSLKAPLVPTNVGVALAALPEGRRSDIPLSPPVEGLDPAPFSRQLTPNAPRERLGLAPSPLAPAPTRPEARTAALNGRFDDARIERRAQARAMSPAVDTNRAGLRPHSPNIPVPMTAFAPNAPTARPYEMTRERAASADDDRVLRPKFGAEARPARGTSEPAPMPVAGLPRSGEPTEAPKRARPTTAPRAVVAEVAAPSSANPTTSTGNAGPGLDPLPDNVVPFPGRSMRPTGEVRAEPPAPTTDRFAPQPHRSLLDAVMELHPDRPESAPEAAQAFGQAPTSPAAESRPFEASPVPIAREAPERAPADQPLPREWSVRVDDEVTVQVTVEGREVSVHVETTDRASASLDGLHAELSSELSHGGHHLAEYHAERRGRPGRFERTATTKSSDEPEPTRPVGRGHSVNRVV